MDSRGNKKHMKHLRNQRMRTLNLNQHRQPKAVSLRHSNTSNGGHRKTKSLNSTQIKPYMNSTGPGDYTAPSLWGTTQVLNSKMKSSPYFSMGQRCKTPILSKEQTQDIRGKGTFIPMILILLIWLFIDAPGSTLYSIPSYIGKGEIYNPSFGFTIKTYQLFNKLFRIT